MSTMRAKMQVVDIEPLNDEHEVLHFIAVGKNEEYSEDGLDENNTFAKFTPSAELSMMVANPNLIGTFEVGQNFYVDFVKVD